MTATPPPLDGPAPGPQPPAPAATNPLAELRARLAELTPRIPVTTALVVLNVAVFALMAAKGVSPMSPTVDDLLNWGANFAPLTTSHQGWWRLVTSMFVHVGLIHLAFNMWVLWSTGQLVERMLGPAAFAVTYLLAGIAGSCTSVAWNPDRASAGASGAIFGVLGALIAFLLRHRSDMPADAFKSLRKNAATMLAYNLGFGLIQKQVDMAAHVGGLLGGFVVAWFLVHAPTAEARAGRSRRTRLVLAAGLIAAGGLWTLLPRLTTLRSRAENLPLTQRQLPGAALLLPVGPETEVRSDYASGHLRVNLPESGTVSLDWHTDAMLSEADTMRMLVTPLTRALNATIAEYTKVLVGGQQGWRYVFKPPGEALRVTMTAWPCGKRVFTLSVAMSGHATLLEERLRTSFVCHPDPARDGVLPVVPVGVQVDLGPDWGLGEDGKMLTFGTLEGQVYLVTPLPAQTQLGSDFMKTFVPQYLVSSMGAMGVSDAAFEAANLPGRSTHVWRGQGTREKRPVRMLVTAIPCEASPYLIFYLGPRDRPEADALRLLDAAHCAATVTRPRPLADIAREACARGDKRGCD